MILACVEEAVRARGREDKACDAIGLSVRTVQRWRLAPDGDDRREGRHSLPSHALTEAGRRALLAAIHRPEHHDASPKTIVAKLADGAGTWGPSRRCTGCCGPKAS